VKGRGELQLGVLLENMRREGFEVCVSQPRVLFEKKDDGTILEPIEEVLREKRGEAKEEEEEKKKKRKERNEHVL
jgi:GTP-binding protein